MRATMNRRSATGAARRRRAAAMRYTSAARGPGWSCSASSTSTPVDMRPTTMARPRSRPVLPARFPTPGQRLDGIAVGMATNIRANLREITAR